MILIWVWGESESANWRTESANWRTESDVNLKWIWSCKLSPEPLLPHPDNRNNMHCMPTGRRKGRRNHCIFLLKGFLTSPEPQHSKPQLHLFTQNIIQQRNKQDINQNKIAQSAFSHVPEPCASRAQQWSKKTHKTWNIAQQKSTKWMRT